ncbi:MAG: hypothetical protein JWP57_322 [Spirosoma sp.]|nr:hypothetical protein [Spirosoma sp.]
MFSSVLSPKGTKKIGFWFKIVVFVGLLAYIGYVLGQQRFDWSVVQHQLEGVHYPERWAVLLVLLTPINWGLESLKWQILLKRVEKTSYWEAFQGVLAGLSLGFALPAQLGDTAGRVLSIRTSARAEDIGASLVSGGMQFYVALVFGTLACSHHMTTAAARYNLACLIRLILLVGLSVLGVLFGLVRRKVVGWLATRLSLRRFAGYWNVAGQYDDWEISRALVAAALRYLVFSGQFYVAMQLVGVELPLGVSTSGIGVVFLAKTITPAFNLLSDLGVREAASLWVFEPFGVPAPVLITATLTLWVANILLPVLIGLIWVWRLKWSVR